MPRIAYIEREFAPRTLDTIDQANAIIEEYQAQGFDLTLRQLYYQFVARDLIPNRDREYKRLGSIVNDGRLAGLIDWTAIQDRTRNIAGGDWGYESPAEFVDGIWNGYSAPMWADQSYAPEVWIEKDALSGVIARPCDELRIPYFSCRGYTSQSEMWGAAQRLRRLVNAGKTPVIFHFGDHDPSGVDMSRDIRERLSLFGAPVEFHRLALNMDQVQEYQPPPNPAKLTDSRVYGYIASFGDESWELDALDPTTLASLVRDAVRPLINVTSWNAAVERTEAGKTQIREALEGVL